MVQGERLGFVVRSEFLVAPTIDVSDLYEARTVGYWYQILDREGRELLAYHWHPEGVSPVVTPHVHMSHARWTIAPEGSARGPALADLHLPTVAVALADVVRRLITDLGARPRRPDWDDVLRANRHVPQVEG